MMNNPSTNAEEIQQIGSVAKNSRVKKVKEDVLLTPRRRSARLTQRINNQSENSEQDSATDEVSYRINRGCEPDIVLLLS